MFFVQLLPTQVRDSRRLSEEAQPWNTSPESRDKNRIEQAVPVQTSGGRYYYFILPSHVHLVRQGDTSVIDVDKFEEV